MWILYNFLLTLLAPVWVPWMIIRSKRRREQPNWRERTGEYDIPRKEDRKRIWIHAVSVGEVIASRPILRELRKELPDYEIVLTCTTSTGHEVAKPMVGSLINYLFYFPIDVPRFCVAAMIRVEPAVVVIMETELWMNFLSAAKMTRAKTCIANGRISERSFRRAIPLRFFYRALLRNVDECFMQTEADYGRIKALGASTASVLGNSKYDEASAPDMKINWQTELELREGCALVVVGSARAEEEDFILEALHGTNARILFAPRHIERAAAVAEKARAAGFETGLRSAGQNGKKLVILDTFGELASAYAFADLAVVGGGFADLGGQNLIQPLAAGCPVICGPHMRNFLEPFEAGIAEGAVRVASTSAELRSQVREVLDGAELRRCMSAAGRELVARNQGAAKRYAMAVAELARGFEASRTPSTYLASKEESAP